MTTSTTQQWLLLQHTYQSVLLCILLLTKTHAGNRDDAEQSDDDVLEMW